jgi:Sec-independent protein secretion pathway component TatC
MILIVGPHWFRRSLRPALATARRSATLGFLLLAAGLFFLGLALGPFRAS